MSLFRRRAPLPPGFVRACDHVDRAQRALLAAIPTARRPGAPLAEALAEFSVHLYEAEEALASWGMDTPERAGCIQSLAVARGEAEKIRLNREALGFEALNARVGDVLHPLEAFADAERSMMYG